MIIGFKGLGYDNRKMWYFDKLLNEENPRSIIADGVPNQQERG